MKPRVLFSWAVLSSLLWLSAAETQPATAAARRSRPAPVISPEVQADGRVTLRIRAPQAEEVLVNGQWAQGNTAMTRDAEGLWSVTVGPVSPGVYEYAFQVDGLRMIDPGNAAIKPMREPRTSILHLPGQPPLIHDFQDVPHGVVREHAYWSQPLGRLRYLTVYTPAGYDQHPDLIYPTLYLQHGSGDNQATWTEHGKAHWILDNLIAGGHARPMVVVMMDGHAVVPGGNPGNRESNTEAFERDLLEQVMPFIEASYRVRKEASQRALVGLSMGGGQSLTIGLNHTDRFAWVGGFSSSAPSAEAVAAALDHPDTTNERLKLLWIACGKDDFLLARNREFLALLQDKGIRNEWHLTEGDHSWPVWRVYLADLAPRLFQ